jgi:excisionase family DNA binding protein
MGARARDLKVQEVAQRMGTHAETIRRWLRAGKFPHAYQISNRYGWRIPEADVDALRRPQKEPETPK